MPFLAVFVLWSVVDLVLMLVLSTIFQEQSDWGIVVRIALSAAAGAVLFWAVFSNIKVEGLTGDGNSAS
jgi:hypothetical protein